MGTPDFFFKKPRDPQVVALSSDQKSSWQHIAGPMIGDTLHSSKVRRMFPGMGVYFFMFFQGPTGITLRCQGIQVTAVSLLLKAVFREGALRSLLFQGFLGDIY